MHHLIADRLHTQLRRGTGLGTLPNADYARLRALASEPRNLPYLFLGCQGPDFFFFNARDVDPTIGKLVNTYFDVYDFLEEFREKVLALVPEPILVAIDAVEEAIEQTVDASSLLSELQQTFAEFSATGAALAATLSEKIKEWVADFNLFNVVSHPYRDGVAAGEWWWFDVMHYRKTGKFAKALLEKTNGQDSPLHLYALGYLTHFAADTVGHPYVGIFSGGSYRSHPQRHKVGENFQDVHNFLAAAQIDWNASKIHHLYNFNFDGSASAPNESTNLPDDLARLIADTLNEIFQEGPGAAGRYSPVLTAEDVNDTYRLWYRWYAKATETGTIPPPFSYSLSEELVEVWDQAMENLEGIGDFLQDAADFAGENGILGIFLAIGAMILGGILAVVAIADAIAGAVTTLSTATLRAGACLLYELAFDAFQSFRLGIALNGLAFPMLEHMNEPRFAQFIKPDVPDPTGVTAAQIANRMPLLRERVPFASDPLAAIFARERHLVYAPTAGELAAVQMGPQSYFSELPLHYAFGQIPLTAGLIDQIAALPQISGNHEAAIAALMQQGQLGNAMTLIGELYRRARTGGPIPDFNMDADRGYGYPCWTQLENGVPDAANVPGDLLTNGPGDPNYTIALRFLP